MRGDRLGLIGPNGAGKSTLIKLILGKLEPDSGKVRLGTNLLVAYFDQLREQLDPDKSVAETISPGSDWIEIGTERKHVMTYLGDFLFPPQRANSPVKALSGGERNRLLLARLFARPANVLVMDEPTNDLDIDSLELLEDTLQSYAGTLLLVSHDRAFLDNVVTQTLVAQGDGTWQEYVGGYTDWLAQRPAPVSCVARETETGSQTGARAPPPVKLSYKETRELAQLPAEIEAHRTTPARTDCAHELGRLSQTRRRPDQGRPEARRGSRTRDVRKVRALVVAGSEGGSGGEKLTDVARPTAAAASFAAPSASVAAVL